MNLWIPTNYFTGLPDKHYENTNAINKICSCIDFNG